MFEVVVVVICALMALLVGSVSTTMAFQFREQLNETELALNSVAKTISTLSPINPIPPVPPPFPPAPPTPTATTGPQGPQGATGATGERGVTGASGGVGIVDFSQPARFRNGNEAAFFNPTTSSFGTAGGMTIQKNLLVTGWTLFAVAVAEQWKTRIQTDPFVGIFFTEPSAVYTGGFETPVAMDSGVAFAFEGGVQNVGNSTYTLSDPGICMVTWQIEFETPLHTGAAATWVEFVERSPRVRLGYTQMQRNGSNRLSGSAILVCPQVNNFESRFRIVFQTTEQTMTSTADRPFWNSLTVVALTNLPGE